MTKDRRTEIFGAIVEHFIKTAEPVGSKTIILSYDFKVSPATVRNDMAELEEAGLLEQPHTSAGRVPTDKGYRLYVNELANFEVARRLALKNIEKIRETYLADNAKRQVHRAVQILSQSSPNLSFATIPNEEETFFMGVSKMLRQPEFIEAPLRASQVLEVMEDKRQFLEGIANLDLSNDATILIGEENILEGFESCSLIVTRYQVEGFAGAIGILGPKRMPYAYNSALITEVRNLLESHQL